MDDYSELDGLNDENPEMTEEQAATKIQATWRGHSERKKLQEKGIPIKTPRDTHRDSLDESGYNFNDSILNSSRSDVKADNIGKDQNNKLNKQTLKTPSTTKQSFSKQLGSLQNAINELSNQITDAEHRTSIAEKEASMRLETIKKLKKLHATSLEDFNNVNSTLAMRNQQISSLKETVKQLQNELQMSNQRNAELQVKIEENQEIIHTQSNQLKNVNEELTQTFQHDVQNNPKTKQMIQELNQLRKDFEIEKEARKNAVNAWHKSNNKLKEYESSYPDSTKKLKQENEKLKQKIQFQTEKEINLKNQNDAIKNELKQLQNEAMQLKIRLSSIETEIKSSNEVERVKQSQWSSTMMQEFKWREHLLMTKLNSTQQELNVANMARLQLSKELKAAEVELAEHNVSKAARDNTDNKRNGVNDEAYMTNKTITKRKYRELEEIDHEIAQLKRNIHMPMYVSFFYIIVHHFS